MRITSKGQVTIPADIREKAGLLPHTEVAFEYDGKFTWIVPVVSEQGNSRGDRIVARLRGRLRGGLTTDEIMAMTRGED